MSAKIKERNPHGVGGHKYKPRRVSDRQFEKAYWPFIPVLLIASVLLGLSAQTGALATYIKHPSSKVLSYAVSSNANRILAATNTQRVNNNEPSLVENDQLTQAAQTKANDMAARNYWSHNTPEGTQPWAFVTNTGYSYDKLGENLAAGFSDESSVVKAWMASETHRANILDPTYTQVGFGFANSKNYSAAGGGPMTIVVAYYGEPYGTTAAFASKSSTSIISTDNPNAVSQPASTTRSSIAFSKTSATSWGPAAVMACLLALVVLFATKHMRALKLAFKRSESYVWHHPLLDLGVLLITSLLIIFSQTAGYIQ